MKSGYGLLYKPKNIILGVSSSSNAGGHDCHDETYTLSMYEDENIPWIVDDELTAAYVRMFSTPWYNAGYDTPVNDFKPEDLEVIQIEIKVKKIKSPTVVPTFEEYMQDRYNTPGEKFYDPKHYDFIMKSYAPVMNDGKKMYYSLYDLKDLVGFYDKK